MKRLLKVMLLLGIPMMAVAASGPQVVYNSTVTYNTTPSINLQAYGSPQISAKNLSVQVTYSSVAFNTASFFDGSQSTGNLTVVSTSTIVALAATDSITVPSTSAILGTPATNQITIVSTTGIAGLTANFTFALSNYTGISASSPSIILNGQQFYTWAGNWASTDTIQHAATTLATAINTSGIYTAVVVNSTGVQVNLVSSGSFANGYTANSSSPTDTSTGTFSGGTNPMVVTLTTPQQSLQYIYGGNWISSDTTSHVATTLCNAIVAAGTSDQIMCNAGASVVYASATAIGTVGNSYTSTTTASSIVSVSSSSFLGGTKPALLDSYFTINGTNYRNGAHWSDVSGTSTGTALSITTFINSVSTNNAVAGGGLENIIATQAGGVVNLQTATKGTANNAITLTATPSTGGLTIGSPTFLGGQDNASITINGTKLTLGTDFAPPQAASTTANMATSIASAMNANAVLSKIVTAQAVASVVNSTSVGVGLVNYTTVSSTQSQLSFANATMTGGTTSAVTLGSGLISLPAHGFAPCLPVVYTTGTVVIGGLINNTTYYPIIVDANDIELATSSLLCQGTTVYVVVSSTNTQTAKHTYMLTPVAYYQGAAGGFWQVSNDGVNWNTFGPTLANVTVSSQTYTAVYPNVSAAQDWGPVDFGYMRYNITAPLEGGIAVKATLNAKD